MDLELIRDVATSTYTYGTITIGSLMLQTLELPWLPEPGQQCGRPDRSCVPAGLYLLDPHNTASKPFTWALVNQSLGIYHEMPNPPPACLIRTACLIHVANKVSQLEGCIGVGRDRELKTPPEIWRSDEAFQALKAVLAWQPGHTLTISYAAGVTPP